MTVYVAILAATIVGALTVNAAATRAKSLLHSLAEHRELERAAQRQRIALARIEHICRAAEQAMWDESLREWSDLHR